MASPVTLVMYWASIAPRAVQVSSTSKRRGLTFLIGIAFLAALTSSKAYTPGAGIDGTPHDWSMGDGTTVLLWTDGNGNATTYNTGTPWIDPATSKQGTSTVANGKCATCHLQDATDYATLQWNYTLRSTGYRWNDPSTTAGTPYPTFHGDTYKGPTVKCLSCHDGLLAKGSEVSHGMDMSHNHPVAMPYPINGAPNTYNFVRNGANIEMNKWVPDPMAANGVRLFNDDGAGNIAEGVVPGRTGIECSSCHDVHNGPRVKDQLLVTGLLGGRGLGAGGYICNECHVK
jgi:hypothetical protein